MSRADTYLRSILTAAQWEELRRQRNHDNQDSVARQKYRFYHKTHMRAELAGSGWVVKKRAANLAWLVTKGYCDPAGNWIADIKL